ncbi:MAG: 2',3'-cyclic-nucleotide 2'-phosphodiesterase 5'-nucleotidase [Holophagaceae bacterium]|nr:2',3'-cyclic-nucleotide 2'-phosphodiesterase 5'-nucleotidase [Holophagaceae bacterium]
MVRWLFILSLTLALGAEDLHIQVLCTADLHGQVAASDPFTLQPMPQGWTKAATLLRGLKAANPNTLLVDCGDALTGDPTAYVRYAVRPELPEPNVAIMNALGYHAMAVGNRDFAFGFPYLRSVEEQAQFPFLAANLVLPDGKPAFTPYAKLEIGGVSVAVLGLATSIPARIADLPSLEDIRVVDPVETARALVPRLRQNEKVDLVVLALHGALPLKEAIPGVDLILMAHGGQTEAAGIPVLHPRSNGREIGVADCTFHKDWGRWKVKSLATKLIPVAAETPVDSQVVELTSTSVRQFYALMPSEQRVARIRITGAQLRAYLEHAAHYYNFSHLPELISKDVSPEDFDVLDGVSYALDISKPQGSRVVSLNYQGMPVKDSQEFTLGISERRLAGRGGYLEAMGFQGQVEWVSPTSWRNILLTYVLGRPSLNPVPTRQWRIIPSLDRERVMAQER